VPVVAGLLYYLFVSFELAVVCYGKGLFGKVGGKGRITLPFCCYDDMVHTAIILFFFASYFFSEKGAWSVLDSLLKLSIQLALMVSITVLGGVLQS